MVKIKSIIAREILASDGFPTVKCQVVADNGTSASAAVSYGASVGVHEATVFVDGDQTRYAGKGVLKVCHTIEQVIAPELVGMDLSDQRQIDESLLKLDSSDRKERLGGNAVLAVSMAAARAGAKVSGLQLFQHLENVFGLKHENILPKPMVVVIEGGKHADNSTDLQEYLLTMTHSESVAENVRVASEIYHTAKTILKKEGWSVNVGNEGAFAPEGIQSNSKPLDILMQAITDAGFIPGKDAWLSLDPASSEFFHDGKYFFACENRTLDGSELLSWYKSVVARYPIYSLEDMFVQDSWDDWTRITQDLGNKIRIIGDDLTVTNLKRLQKAVEYKAINAVLIKLNQAGTVTETIDACKFAKENNFLVVPSQRGGGEANDTFLVDLAVACGAEFIKVGITRGERVVKYNRLMEIERQLQKI